MHNYRQPGALVAANEQMGMEVRDVWTAAYMNDLPDSAFLLIEPGGTKDSDGKTTPRSKRHFPVYDSSGKLDEPHLANALARIPQASSLSADQRATAMNKAKALAKKSGVSGPPGTYAGSAGSGRSRGGTNGVLVAERSFSLVMEIREHGDGRTLYGRAVPYNVTTTIGAGRERFVPGAFSRQIAHAPAEHIKLYDAHTNRIEGRTPVGKTIRLSEQPDGLYGEWRVFDTSAGEDALKLVKAGEVTGLSIGFRPERGGSVKVDDVVEQRSAHLDHVALTHEPQYETAGVLSVRSRMREFEATRERLRVMAG